MNKLKEKIKQDGVVLPNNVLKVNSFLNHGVDTLLLADVAQAIANHFAGKKITKVLTAETSGIVPATLVALVLKVPMVFARKQKSATLKADVYAAHAFSYTKQNDNALVVQKNLLNRGDSVLIVDDFLANGQAVLALADVCKQAQADVVGAGIVIEKAFQKGAKILADAGIEVFATAKIKSLDKGIVEFCDEGEDDE